MSRRNGLRPPKPSGSLPCEAVAGEERRLLQSNSVAERISMTMRQLPVRAVLAIHLGYAERPILLGKPPTRQRRTKGVATQAAPTGWSRIGRPRSPKCGQGFGEFPLHRGPRVPTACACQRERGEEPSVAGASVPDRLFLSSRAFRGTFCEIADQYVVTGGCELRTQAERLADA